MARGIPQPLRALSRSVFRSCLAPSARTHGQTARHPPTRPLSIGVAHLARLMTEHLQKSQPELDITDRDVRCVMLAGLCHDLGHGPWSHVWDSMFIPRALSVPAAARLARRR